MSRLRIVVRLSVVLAAVATAKGCGDGKSPTAPPTQEPARPTTVTVSPATTELTALGATVQLTAEVRDQIARVMAGATVTWASSASSVVTVDGSGLVTGVAEGTATITASAGSAAGSAVVTVAQLVASVQVSPATAELTVLGTTVQLMAEGFDGNGHLASGAEFSWESSDAAVATVDASGLVTGVAQGMVTVTATSGSARGTAEITVGADPERAALVALYEATDGPNWVEADNWLTDAPLGDWYGVGTDASGRVVRLELDANRLSGPIPSELGNLTGLTGLDFQNNGLSGPIPPELGNLTSLTILWLSGNDLSGPIPPELGNLTNLIFWLLSNNGLTGPIPESVLQIDGLKWFRFQGNAGLCAPGTSEFVTWLQAIVDDVDGPYCNESDMAVLEVVYETAGGPNWITADGWLQTPVLEEWYGVATDSVGRVVGLDLARNGLEGQLPANLGVLATLTTLRVGDNMLSGRLPLSLAHLPLVEFHYAGTGLCVPAEVSFQAWLDRVASHEGTGVVCDPLSDREVLVALYEATGGRNWANADNWLTTAPLGEWYGVSADTQGRVTKLYFRNNNLEGSIPPELGSLASLTELWIEGNNLTGSIPSELGSLASLTDAWLINNGFTGPIPAELGNLTSLTDLRIMGNNLMGSIPPELGSLASLTELWLMNNGLSGPIPAELGDLTSLRTLQLDLNNLSGPIPSELGSLAGLISLGLRSNDLSGPIPVELGNLSSLKALNLSRNNLTDSIPPGLGSLADLNELWLRFNDLSGSIPPELGDLASLHWLYLDDNGLTGPVPPEFGGLSNLIRLSLANNSGMSGALPATLTGLRRLETLAAGGTDLCAPADPGFQAWLDRVFQSRVAVCANGEPPMAYLTQAVQSPEYPVPLVAGEKALLRVFVTAAPATTAGIPPVRAQFYLNGTESYVADIPATTTPIPSEAGESSLSESANAEIPGQIVQPGLEMVIEIDPDGTLDPRLGVARRIPETGRMAVDVRELPVFDLTVIPFLWSADPNREVVETAEGMATDPTGHELLWDTRTLLPIANLEVNAHEPVLVSSNNALALLAEARAIRAIEGGSGHFMGMMSGSVAGPAGAADWPGWATFSIPAPSTMAHELGHNLGLGHAPCGDPRNHDPSFPHRDGSTGAWGYDFRDGGRLVPPSAPDLMSYCRPRWISDYHFTNALRYRLRDEDPAMLVAGSLLVWGGMGAAGEPFLNPAFVIDAPRALPDSIGAHLLTGRTARGDELFALSFTMPDVADGDGSSSFAFVLPIEPGWANSLASITLSGPGGSATLDGDTDLPMTILLHPGTGQVRGILRGVPQLDAAAFARQAATDSLNVLFSRGIPDSAAWGR